MRWCKRTPLPPPPDFGADPDGAEEARRAAERELQRVRAQRGEVSNVSHKLRAIRKRNHFAELIDDALAERTE